MPSNSSITPLKNSERSSTSENTPTPARKKDVGEAELGRSKEEKNIADESGTADLVNTLLVRISVLEAQLRENGIEPAPEDANYGKETSAQSSGESSIAVAEEKDDVVDKNSDDQRGDGDGATARSSLRRGSALIAQEVFAEFRQTVRADADAKAVRVAIPVLEPFVVDSKDNIGRWLFGDEVADRLWVYQRNIIFQSILMILWVIGLMIASISFTAFLDNSTGMAFGIIMLPPIILYSSTLNLRLIGECLKRFESWLLLIYGITTCISLAGSFTDMRSVPCVTGILCCAIFAVFMDALPSALRSNVNMSTQLISVIFLLSVNAGFYFNIIPNVNEHTLFSIGASNYTWQTLFFSASTNYALYSSKLVVTAVMYPDRYALMESKVLSVKVESQIATRVIEARREIE